MQDIELCRFVRAHQGIKPEELAAHLGVKCRAMRERIRRANRSLAGSAFISYDRTRAGYALRIDDVAALDLLLDGGEADPFDRLPATPQERSAYLVQDLLSRAGWITLEDLSEMLFVSRSTISSDLRRVSAKLAAFDLRLERRPRYGIRVAGSELSRRLCLASIAVDSVLDIEQLEASIAPGKLDAISRCVEGSLAGTGFKINPVAHQNLIVHIAIALVRIEQRCYVPLDAASIERIRESTEYDRARVIARAIEREFTVRLPTEEIAYIAIHLASKRLFDASPNGLDDPAPATCGDRAQSADLVITDEAWDAAAEMTEAVWRAFRFDLRHDMELRMNLARHIMPLAVRLRYNMSTANPLTLDLKSRFPLAWFMAVDASEVLVDRYGAMPSEAEIGYLSLAFALAIERQSHEKPKKRVLAVCASGAGSARLMAYRLQHLFGEYISSVLTCDITEFAHIDLAGIDCIFTTVPLTRRVGIPVLQISLFVDGAAHRAVSRALARDCSSEVRACFSPALFFAHLPFTTRSEVISFLCARAREVEGTPDGFEDLVWKRERMAPTSFGNLVALPHPYEAISARTFVTVGLLDREIAWSTRSVRAVFLISVAKDAGSDLEAFYRSMVGLLIEQASIQRVLDAMSIEALMKELEGA